MEASKRLIPYSVHLTPEIYEKLKELAQERKASKLVRDAITMIIKGKGDFDSGYNKGIMDAIDAVAAHHAAHRISFDETSVADSIIDQLEILLK
jgi:predicted DNA-binding protein